ncbi:hypothetical protein Vretimale_19398, partial [Volvox reticuliferus]
MESSSSNEQLLVTAAAIPAAVGDARRWQKKKEGKSFSKKQPGDFKTKYPKIILPQVPETGREQNPTTANEVIDPLPRSMYGSAWRRVWELAAPHYIYLTHTCKFPAAGSEAGVKIALAPLFTTIAAMLGSQLKCEHPLTEDAGTGKLDFVFQSSNKGRKGPITFVVEVKKDLSCSNGYKYYLEQMYFELMAAWEMNCKVHKLAAAKAPAASNPPAEAPAVWGMLLDLNGGVVFQLVIRSDPGASKETREGHIACSEYLPVFSHGMPSHGMPSAFHYILQAVNPACKEWTEETWNAVAYAFEIKTKKSLYEAAAAVEQMEKTTHPSSTRRDDEIRSFPVGSTAHTAAAGPQAKGKRMEKPKWLTDKVFKHFDELFNVAQTEKELRKHQKTPEICKNIYDDLMKDKEQEFSKICETAKTEAVHKRFIQIAISEFKKIIKTRKNNGEGGTSEKEASQSEALEQGDVMVAAAGGEGGEER